MGFIHIGSVLGGLDKAWKILFVGEGQGSAVLCLSIVFGGIAWRKMFGLQTSGSAEETVACL